MFLVPHLANIYKVHAWWQALPAQSGLSVIKKEFFLSFIQVQVCYVMKKYHLMIWKMCFAPESMNSVLRKHDQRPQEVVFGMCHHHEIMVLRIVTPRLASGTVETKESLAKIWLQWYPNLWAFSDTVPPFHIYPFPPSKVSNQTEIREIRIGLQQFCILALLVSKLTKVILNGD